MAGVPLNFVDDLNSVRDFWDMKARVIKVWRLNYRMDCILLDERGSKIHGVIKNHLIKDFEETVKEDAVVFAV
ncbi:hypothetical protein QVD17_12853 [Tagetes erecta]|uniref:Replication protein A 70 kDa DNA-binding subunit B/D first OB fold domain-containing protein n=1 Tax=Tagetes erecta TaxID=13708 RepID=A0AAD8P345_TARER|nr:hypothetical protein QVD17_12853 [Tagetes erecta]